MKSISIYDLADKPQAKPADTAEGVSMSRTMPEPGWFEDPRQASARKICHHGSEHDSTGPKATLRKAD